MKGNITKVFALILVLLLSVCCVLFAGCSIVDPDTWDDDDFDGSGSGGSGSGSGSQSAEIVPNKFKMGYRGTAQDTNVEENIKTLAETLVTDFASTFGAGNGYGDFKDENGYYYDSIRYQAYDDTATVSNVKIDMVMPAVDKGWNWSFLNDKPPLFVGAAPAVKNTYIDTESGAASTYHTDNFNSYIDFYKNLYSEAMEVVLYEILLGKTDYENMIVVGNNFDANGYPVVTYRGQSVSVVGGKLDFSSILTTLKAEYFDKTTYFGFSLEDGAKIKNYIINYVIGEKAHKDKDGNDQLNANRNYNAYVTARVDELINSQTEYYWYARTGFKDGRLAISSTGDYFGLVPKAEYQSLVLMAEEEDEFISCRIALWSDVNVSGQVILRYFDDNNTKTVSVRNFSIKAYGKDDDCIVILAPETSCRIDAFDNYNAISATTEKLNQQIDPTYKIVDIGKNAIVFNEELSDGAYIEILFLIDESTQGNANYSGFKVAFLNLDLLTNKNNADE